MSARETRSGGAACSDEQAREPAEATRGESLGDKPTGTSIRQENDFGGRERFVDGRTVCKFLAISPRTLSRWLVEHDAFPRYWVGGGWRFRLSEVERWAKQNRGHHEKKRGRR